MLATEAPILLRCAESGETTRPRGRTRLALREALLGDRLSSGLRYDTGGRPGIARGSCGWSDLSFSATGGLFVAALARDQRIGVDVERIPPGIPEPEFVEEVLSLPERAEFSRLSADWDRLLVAWCRKEAVLKLLGFGLAIHPERIEVGLRPAFTAPIRVAIPGGGGVWVLDLCVAPGVACAVASDAPIDREKIRIEWQRRPLTPTPP